MALSTSRTGAVGGSTAIDSRGRITCCTRMSKLRPIFPPGSNFAKSTFLNPRASNKTIAIASPSASIAVVLEVGARFNGQASCSTFTSRTTCAFFASVESESPRSEEHTSELQSLAYLVCRLLLEKKNLHKLLGECATARDQPNASRLVNESLHEHPVAFARDDRPGPLTSADPGLIPAAQLVQRPH